MKVLIGTNNKSKIKKYGTIFDELGIEYCTPADLSINIDIKESGNTPEENSKIKAREYFRIAKIPTIADDSGLEIYGLPKEKQPGVYVRRKDGKRLTDDEWISTYSELIKKLGGKTKGAFITAITIIDDNGKEYTNILRHEHIFISTPCKTRNEGYPANSLIFNEEKNKYLAEINENKSEYKGNSYENNYNFIKSVFIL